MIIGLFLPQDLCNTIKRLPADRVEEMAIKLDLVTGIPEVDCFIDDMSDFYDVSSFCCHINILYNYINVIQACKVPTTINTDLIYMNWLINKI